MITATQAFQSIMTRTPSSYPTSVPLTQALGMALAEDLFADRDQPPFHRAMMDGVALKRSQLSLSTCFNIVDLAAAGKPALNLPDGNFCIEIMTGAVIPWGADLVIRYEDLKIENGSATIAVPMEQLSRNIHSQGQDYVKGDKLLGAGRRINSAVTAILASAGVSEINVWSPPRVSILSTGDELVDIHQTPQPHELRWSNGITLQQELASHGFATAEVLRVRDDEQAIRGAIQELLGACQILLITGGVSAGKFDFIPKALKDCGVVEIFHKVLQRPGKPLWFGETKDGKLVFGLPGNPVSCLVNLRRFVVPLLQKSVGLSEFPLMLRLAQEMRRHPELTVFAPVKLKLLQGELSAYPMDATNSGDFYQLRDSQGFVELPPGSVPFPAGELAAAYLWGGTCLS